MRHPELHRQTAFEPLPQLGMVALTIKMLRSGQCTESMDVIHLFPNMHKAPIGCPIIIASKH